MNPQQSRALPRKLSNSPADLSARRPHRAQELPRSSFKQHRPPAPQPSSSSAANVRAGAQSSFLDSRHASPNPHLRHHPHQMPNLAHGEHRTLKQRNEAMLGIRLHLRIIDRYFSSTTYTSTKHCPIVIISQKFDSLELLTNRTRTIIIYFLKSWLDFSSNNLYKPSSTSN